MCGSRSAFACIATLFVVTRAASADETPLAESLFQQGVAAMDRGEFAHACDLFSESQRLDPGGGTLLNLAVCHERAGQLATAWARYHEALGIARRDRREDRVAFAEEHIRALEPRVPRVAIVLAETTEGMRVKVDGVELHGRAWEAPAPVDPGDHLVRVEAPGRRAHLANLSIVEGETKRVVVPTLARDADLARNLMPPSARGGTQRVFGWTFTGLGGSALIGSAVLGALAIGAESTADAACPGSGACSNPRGLEASERASNLSTAATITAISGAVMLAGGLILLLTAPR